MGRLSELKGFGPFSERCLNEIGIYSKEDLEGRGVVRTFVELKAKGVCNASLNFLYAMVGALENKHWAQIAKTEKGRLMFELEGYRELEELLNKDRGLADGRRRKIESGDFERIPGVGKKMNKRFVELGYHKVSDLIGEDPEVMYQNLMALRGGHVDRCVLYVFRCAVYYASHSIHDVELLKWWNWKDSK